MKPLAVPLLVATCALALAAIASAAGPPTSAAAAVVKSAETAPPVAQPMNAPAYGPIRAKDPLVRAEIKRLYLELRSVQEATIASVKDLDARYAAETDPDFRFELAQKIREAKLHLERRNLEIGLQIARLNNDAVRVAEFEKALDQLLHPEKYARPSQPDRTIERQRVRELEGK
jgi:hypothetical protein